MEFDSSSHSFMEEDVLEPKHSGEDAMFSQPFSSQILKKRGRDVAEAWIPGLLAGQFFVNCPCHKDIKKNECTYYCTTCAKPGAGLCQHCLPDHHGHDLLQIRRYVYCDVLRTADIVPSVDITGVQTYIINQAKVIFLNNRPQSRFAKTSSTDVCKTCHRGLREGCSFCSLACRVSHLQNRGKRLKASPASSEEAEFDHVPAHILPRQRLPVSRPQAPAGKRVSRPRYVDSGEDEWESATYLTSAPVLAVPARHACKVIRSRRKQTSPRRSPIA